MTGRRAVLGGRRGGSSLAVGLVLATGVLVGCGGADAGSEPASPSGGKALGVVTTAPDGVQEVILQTQDDYVFTPDRFTVAPGKVRLTVVNAAEQFTHNFRFTPDQGPAPIEPGIPLLAPGESETVEFTVEQPGTYPFECSFHIQLDQVGAMTVRG